jgi:hypothetical protein
MRIDPAPSDPCAMGSSLAATAAPAPPLEPPAVCQTFQGLRVGGCVSGSVTGMAPSSDVAVLPRMTKPPPRSAATVRSSRGRNRGIAARDPKRVQAKRTTFMSLMPMGTP